MIFYYSLLMLLPLVPSSFAQAPGKCEAISFNLFGRVAVVKKNGSTAGNCGTAAVKTFETNPSDKAKVHFSFENEQVWVRGNVMRKPHFGKSGQCELRYFHPIAGELHSVLGQVTFKKCVISAMNNLATNHGKIHEAHLSYSNATESYEGAFAAQPPFKKGPLDARDFNNSMY